MPRVNAPGKCALCGETFSKQAITRHMVSCRSKHPPAVGPKSKLQPTFLLAAEGRDLPMYWMCLEFPARARLVDLDQFLRDAWLECCGHLSAFTIDGVSYELDTGGVDAMWPMIFGRGEPPRSMNARLDSVLWPGLKFFHEYDFGTTTELALKVIAAERGKGKTANLLAHNDPPAIACGKCGQPATQLCVECAYTKAGWLCDRHAAKHRHDDMFLPVVNSPRVGMCGYTGPGLGE